ncbi:MAG: Uncharacterised protein [Hyphomonas sp. TMED17]|nr:MAG: hypothetical protein CBB77_03665 [Hyphomonas sp. TMED17]CAI8357939.1 MAG: Uncharacterised protein [Hyphomonas sp. TMED17]
MLEPNASSESWKFHPDRDFLISEAHARPSETISGPANMLHLAFRAEPAVRRQFFHKLNPNEDALLVRHISATLGMVRVKLEYHTEFMSCTVFQEEVAADNQEDLVDFLSQNFPMGDVEILVLLKLNLLKSDDDLCVCFPNEQRLYGGILRKGIDVRSGFVPDENGFIQFSMHAKGMTNDEIGRRLQRLVEMETYRTMALLGLPEARKVSAELTNLEKELEDLTRLLGGSTNNTQQESESHFERLSMLSERSNVLATNTRYRFAASLAYAALFEQRLDSLEEEKVGKLQTMSGFLKSRFEPAIATIESTRRRQDTLTNDLSRTLVLLRTRIQLNLAKGNQAQLQSMNKRHDQQLKISQTVEGLSIVAITYYAVGLVSYLLKAAADQSWSPLSETLMTAISVPFVLVIVWALLRRLRKAWENSAP